MGAKEFTGRSDARRSLYEPHGSTDTGEWTHMSNTNQVILDHTAAVGHGNTVAAWACIAIMAVGVIVGCVGFTIASTPVTVVGIGLIVVGLIVGAVLKVMGHGKGSEKHNH